MEFKFLWWNLKDVPEFVAMIQKYGHENLRMEVHPREKGDMLRLVPIDEDGVERDGEGQTFNYGHVCPPVCP